MTGKLLYGLLFCAVLPCVLAAWALALEAKLHGLPSLSPNVGGLALAVIGCVMMLRGMWDLWRRGGGLPMSPYPPPKLVAAGAYRWVAHPIYLGFGLLVPGVAWWAGSPAGLWIVTPAVWLATITFVVGFERIALRQRFGRTLDAAWLWLPPALPEAPTLSHRFAAALLAFAPWIVAYEGIAWLGVSTSAVDTVLPFERSWPVWEWTAVFYLGSYLWAFAAPAMASSQEKLRRFVRDAWWGTAFIAWCFLALPLVATPRSFDAVSLPGRLLSMDRALDTPACALPSFHVFWAFLAARLWAGRIGKPAAYGWATAIAVSCVTTGRQSLIDIVAGWLVFLGATRCESIWAALCRWSEKVANAWWDWRVGPVRIINYGGYVALATALGAFLIGSLLGPACTVSIVTVTLCSLAGAGIWGQWLEASSLLSRPFGYYGGLFGGCAGVVAVQLWRGEGWLLLGAFAVAAPLIQGVGRLRCLVQGCCHGRPVPPMLPGIRYTQPLARVCRIAGWRGVPVHATPLYSLLGNLVILGLLIRLWIEGADVAFIAGVYLLLNASARFMEEAFRGESQTVRFGGLPIYQWLSIGCVLAGMGLSVLPAPAAPAWYGWHAAPLAYALPLGLIVWAAMGVDFPESNARMSRLA